MKKLKTLLLMLAVVSAALALAACSCGGGTKNPGDGGTPTPSALSAPTLDIDESAKTLTWNAVPNAVGYSVQVDNGTPTDNGASTSYSLASLTAPAAYSLRVMAKGDGTNYTDSAWSAAKTYTAPETLDAPANLQIDAQTKTLTWDAVSKASGYYVQMNDGTPIDNGASMSYSLADLTGLITYSITVKAYGDGTNYTDSPWSDTETYEIPEIRGLQYTLINGDAEYSVSKGTAANAVIIIPSVHDDKPVTAIASEGFGDYTALTSIEIPSGVTTIGNSAFSSCSSLTSITFGADSQLTSIGNSAFYNCNNLTGALTIPSGVTSIGTRAFYNCSNLTGALTIPSGVTSIESRAFFNCSSLTSIEIPSGVTSIGSSAFSGCGKLTRVYYGGADSAAWDQISIGSANTPLTGAICYYYSETDPAEPGDYWHWVGAVPTAW